MPPMNATPINLICVTGHTAGGKTSFAAHLANNLNGEVISADSRQVYRYMDLGTGKDLDDYRLGDKRIPVHLIDIVDPDAEYSVYAYQKDFLEVFRKLQKKNTMPVLCGGSGLYVQSVLKSYKLISVPVNPEYRKSLETFSDEELISKLKSYKSLHNKTDIENRKRLVRALEIENYYASHPPSEHEFPEINSCILGIKFDRESRRKRITRRLKERLDSGMIEEVKGLLDRGITGEKLEYFGLEYKFIYRYTTGMLSYDEMFEKLNTAIHQFAKRQMTWFRKMEKEGMKIHWLDGHMPMDEKLARSREILEKYGYPDRL